MKKVKIMFATVAITGAIAGIFAYKSNNFSIYCLYRTTIAWNDEEELPETVCKTLGHVDLTSFPNGAVYHAAYISPSLCWNLPSLTPTQYCNNVYTVTILP